MDGLEIYVLIFGIVLPVGMLAGGLGLWEWLGRQLERLAAWVLFHDYFGRG